MKVNLTPQIINIAADLYADLYTRGNLVGDGDILIAATAISVNIPVATNNERHFSRFTGLHVVNWNQ